MNGCIARKMLISGDGVYLDKESGEAKSRKFV
jgi:hypothetical protein